MTKAEIVNEVAKATGIEKVTVQTVVEGTMAPKLLINSRYAIVDAGFHPETAYYCFYVCSDENFV